MTKYVIIGNGVAGMTAAEKIRARDANGQITVITEEPYSFYSRIRLIDFLSRELPEEKLTIKGESWHREQNIDLLASSLVADIHPDDRLVLLDGGSRITYDKLLLATGGISFIPPIAGADRENVFALRTLDDAKKINAAALKNKRVAIIGGGVLGLEAGFNLVKAGNEVTVIEFFPRLLPRQMDAEGGRILKHQLEGLGLGFHLGVKTEAITGTKDADGLRLDTGLHIPADMVIVSAGVRPRAELAKKVGLPVDKGVKVNDRMETSIEAIYAAGDLVEHRGVFYGLWTASQEQGAVAGTNMAGGDETYAGTVMSNTLKVAGVSLFSAGDIDADGKREAIVHADEEKMHYKKMVIEDGRIIGAILYGDVSARAKVLKAIKEKTDVSALVENFEKGFNLSGL